MNDLILGARVISLRNSVKMALPLIAAFSCVNAAMAQNTNQTRRDIVREPIPSVKNIHHVVATKTPSGFDVPRYVSLKYNEMNGRIGPSRNHAIKWQYQKKGLPMIVVAETEMWRKVRDHTGEESWVYRGGLSGQRHVITLDDVMIHKKPDIDSRKIAIASSDMILKLKQCHAAWCNITAASGHQGWVRQSEVWGAESLR